MKSQDHGKCEGCFYFKPRDVDADVEKLVWGPWCLEFGQPVRRIWNAGADPYGHPYLKNKGITAPPELKKQIDLPDVKLRLGNG